MGLSECGLASDVGSAGALQASRSMSSRDVLVASRGLQCAPQVDAGIESLSPRNRAVAAAISRQTLVCSDSPNHRERVAQFQVGEDRFVWGRTCDTGELWFLEEDMAHERRAFVNASVVCPVPGCEAALTTAHYTTKRDHLRHKAGAGGHGRESVLHSQGCALVESWLKETYPRSTVKREEYTTPQGERRADVLLMGPRGDRC